MDNNHNGLDDYIDYKITKDIMSSDESDDSYLYDDSDDSFLYDNYYEEDNDNDSCYSCGVPMDKTLFEDEPPPKGLLELAIYSITSGQGGCIDMIIGAPFLLAVIKYIVYIWEVFYYGFDVFVHDEYTFLDGITLFIGFIFNLFLIIYGIYCLVKCNREEEPIFTKIIMIVWGLVFLAFTIYIIICTE